MAKLQIENGEVPKMRVNPMERPQYSPADATALRAVRDGTASPEQQKRAMQYIVHYVCQTYDTLWRQDPSMKDLALGQALAGQHIVWLLNTAKVITKKITEPEP